MIACVYDLDNSGFHGLCMAFVKFAGVFISRVLVVPPIFSFIGLPRFLGQVSYVFRRRNGVRPVLMGSAARSTFLGLL